MKPRDPFQMFNEADVTRQAQRLRAEHLANWLRGLRRRTDGKTG